MILLYTDLCVCACNTCAPVCMCGCMRVLCVLHAVCVYVWMYVCFVCNACSVCVCMCECICVLCVMHTCVCGYTCVANCDK